MPKVSLKFALILFQWLISAKRALIFLFLHFGRYLERLGRGLVKFIFFPIYKIISATKKETGKWLEPFLGRRQLFYILSFIVALILAADETKALADNKYLSGRYSLLFTYFGPTEDEDEEIFEEGLPLHLPDIDIFNWEAGFLSLSAPIFEEKHPDEPIDITGLSADGAALLPPNIIPGAELGSGRYKIIKYAVQPGDTISNVAQKFRLSVETVLIENKLSLRSILRPGDVLSILPVSGVSHKVKKGDNLKKIASLYRADIQKIVDFNHLTEDELPAGEILIIPEGRRPVVTAPPSPITAVRPPAAKISGAGMLWPTTVRRITQYFKWRHTGIDIAGPTGTPIYAALDGVVEISGWNRGGYGYQVVLRHSNGLKTRYAHNSKLLVAVGQEVAKGEAIALMGSTGRSTGPHVHFEVMVGKVRVNPFLYVK